MEYVSWVAALSGRRGFSGGLKVVSPTKWLSGETDVSHSTRAATESHGWHSISPRGSGKSGFTGVAAGRHGRSRWRVPILMLGTLFAGGWSPVGFVRPESATVDGGSKWWRGAAEFGGAGWVMVSRNRVVCRGKVVTGELLSGCVCDAVWRPAAGSSPLSSPGCDSGA